MGHGVCSSELPELQARQDRVIRLLDGHKTGAGGRIRQRGFATTLNENALNRRRGRDGRDRVESASA